MSSGRSNSQGLLGIVAEAMLGGHRVDIEAVMLWSALASSFDYAGSEVREGALG